MREPPEAPGPHSKAMYEGYNNTNRGNGHRNNFGKIEKESVE